MKDRLEGGCAAARSAIGCCPSPLFVHCCHCLNCQRQTGSAFVVNILIETDRIELLAGEPSRSTYLAAAGRSGYRCPTCQIAVYSRYTRATTRFVRAGTLDDPVRSRAGRPHLHADEAAVGHNARRRPGVQPYYDPEELWPAASLERLAALGRCS